MKTTRYFDHYLAQLSFQTKVTEKIQINVLCSINFFSRKSCHLWDNLEKRCRAG